MSYTKLLNRNHSSVNQSIALIDCNNFYASCERIFNPKLIGKPIVVLSNNDGCIIARSKEAKKLGIKMGEPYFKAKNIIEKNDVKVFSSNYSLYGDISQRVMETLARFAPDIEIYSIDEAFLRYDLKDFESRASRTAKKIKKWTGIPVSIGLAPNKVLSKIANQVVKNYNIMGVAKASLEANVKYMAASLGENNVRVNAISAGPIKTLAASGISGFNDILKIVAEKSPLKRNINTDDVIT